MSFELRAWTPRREFRVGVARRGCFKGRFSWLYPPRVSGTINRRSYGVDVRPNAFALLEADRD